MNRQHRVLAAALLTVGLAFGAIAPAHAATHSFGSQTCTGGFRAAIYLGASGSLTLGQSWPGGSHSETWNNGSTSTTRVKIVPIGVATMSSGYGTYASGWTQAGKDCRIW